ncbi:hypothetical protein SY88_23310, partial [Clostridiales bacterium PH28_bin88]
GAVKAGKALGISSLKNLGESAAQYYYSKGVLRVSNRIEKTDFDASVGTDDLVEIVNDAAKKTFIGGARRVLTK